MVTSFFCELLQIALGNRDDLSQVLKDEEWYALLDESQRQAICGLMLDALEKLAEGKRPSQNILLQWIGIAQVTEQTGKLHRERIVALTSRFSSAGFPTSVLKGVGMSLMYPNPLVSVRTLGLA